MIVDQLAVDADKFFDEVAFENDKLLKEETFEMRPEDCNTDFHCQKHQFQLSRDQYEGLSKSLFFNKLAQYDIVLSEQDKSLICQVFEMPRNLSKLDYNKLDLAFEGEQQNLYALKEYYTV